MHIGINMMRVAGLRNETVKLICRGLTTKALTETQSVLNEAEKIVGYPTSFLNLRWLLNDEVANIALHLRKLIGTDHPLLGTAKDLITNKQAPAWGLIVLLISKAGGLGRHFSKIDCDITAGILHSQRVLAEITEMVRTSNIIHKSLLNLSLEDHTSEDLHFGNKLSLLTGDYLLSSSFKELAGLKCHEVNELVSTCLRDLAEAEFIGPRDEQNRPLPAKPLSTQCNVAIPNLDKETFEISDVLGNAKSEWTLRHLLGGASLLAKCCQATLILAGHQEHLQKQGYLFGRNMALALQANNDLNIFKEHNKSSFSLVCAPLLFHLAEKPDYYDSLMDKVEKRTVSFKSVIEEMRNGTGVRKTIELRDEFTTNALKVLDSFPETDAKTALANLMKTM